MTIYVDNTVLSNFAVVRRPDLLRVALGDQGVLFEEVLTWLVRLDEMQLDEGNRLLHTMISAG